MDDFKIPKKLFGHQKTPEVNLKNLKRAEIILAKVIAKHGDIYLPLFERIRNERIEWEKKESLLQIAHQIANDNQNS